MRNFSLITFNSQIAFPVTGPIEHIEVLPCRVTCIATSTGLAVDFVAIPELSIGFGAKDLAKSVLSRFESEAFEQMDEGHFIAELKC